MVFHFKGNNSKGGDNLDKKLEMCQYDTDASAKGHPQPHAGILQKLKLKKGP